jgi:hypothetical protein
MLNGRGGFLTPEIDSTGTIVLQDFQLLGYTKMFQIGFRRVGGGAPSRPGAGHRPPLKRGVQFSCATLSRRRSLLRCNGRY